MVERCYDHSEHQRESFLPTTITNPFLHCILALTCMWFSFGYNARSRTNNSRKVAVFARTQAFCLCETPGRGDQNRIVSLQWRELCSQRTRWALPSLEALREGYGDFWMFYNSQAYSTKLLHYSWIVITWNLWKFQGNLWIISWDIQILNKKKHKSKKVFCALNF